MAKSKKSSVKTKVHAKPRVNKITDVGTKSKLFVAVKTRINEFLKRRPHRSFRLTRRRDANRSLKLPGYFAFTNSVIKTMWANRKVFGILALTSALATAVIVGIASQDTYLALQKALNLPGNDFFNGALGELGKASLLFVSSATGGISQNMSDIQQLYAGLIVLLTWLVSVWLLRNILAGHKVKFRDGLYNSGAPIVSTFLVALSFVAPALMISLGLIIYSAAAASGLLAGGVEAMLFWCVELILALISIYWIVSTFFALVIVTLPGVYPMQAIKIAGDMVVGRRLRILYRLIWAALNVVVVWALVVIPINIFDSWLNHVWPATTWIPIVPVVLLALSTTTVIFVACYVYLLYRKVVADDAEPA
jgi:hypothetical protein